MTLLMMLGLAAGCSDEEISSNAGAGGSLLPRADLCMPGEYIYSQELRCNGALPAGVPMPEGTGAMKYDSIELPTPMVPGQPYSISTERSVPEVEGLLIQEIIANQLLSNNALGLSGFGLCPNVTCPNR